MKFGAELHGKIYAPWRHAYLNYNELKHELKQRQLDHQHGGWRERDERDFITRYEQELAKVYRFVDAKLTEIKHRVEACEKALDTGTAPVDGLADQLAEILFEVNDLARFHRLNCQGFVKMAKKHDRWTHLSNLTQHYHQTLQKRWPIETVMAQQLDEVVVRISYANIKCEGIAGPPRPPSTIYNDQTAFERATTKYWVHPDNVTEVKSIILFHLPVHIYNKEKQYEAKDAAISSVYFDNPNFDLYTERLERTKGAEAIRFRWYGQETDNIYIERKTHHAEWLDGNSVKDRFMLKEKEVDAFVQGSYTADAIVADMRARSNNGSTDDDSIQHQHFVAKGVERSFRERHLEPMCRVYYNRTAFQRPNDQRLRISLDCNLTFMREDHLDGKVRRPKNSWHRTDVKIDHPFHQVPPSDIHHFPYAVLETKIQTHLGQKVPAWLQALLSSHLVYEVPRFSKYLHGASQIFQERVPVLPWWLEELDKDIRKPPVFGVGLSRSLSLQPLVNGHHRRSLFQPSVAQPQHVSINLMGEADDGKKGAAGTTRKKSMMMASTRRTKDDNNKKGGYGGSGDLLSRFYPKLVDSGKKFISNRETTSSSDPSSQQLPRPISQRMMKRTEPKTFFANERTFISWLQFCALLLTVALNLLNNGDQISRVIGAVFIIMASILCFYALGRYQFRAYQLRTGQFIMRYDDLYGPTILCICLVTALIVNFYLRLPAITEQSTSPSS